VENKIDEHGKNWINHLEEIAEVKMSTQLIYEVCRKRMQRPWRRWKKYLISENA
jgi:hypothetical protein